MDVNDWIGVASVLACLGVTSCATQAPSARTNADEQARERSVAHDGSSEVEEREAVTPRIVVTENGREIDVCWLALTARDSRNSEFVLCFQPVDQPRQGRRLEVQQEGWDPSWSGGHAAALGEWHSFVVLPAHRLDGVVAASKLEPARYIDRPVDLEARCWLEKDTFQLGEGVRVNWSFTNRGNEIVRWKKSSAHGSFKSPCAYELQRDGGEVAPRAFRGGGGGNRLSTENELAPGATLDHYERLDWKYPLDESGVYALRASFSIAVVDPAPRYERLRLSDRAGVL